MRESTSRSATEIGAIIRARRIELGLRQEGIDNVSSTLIRTLERGRAPLEVTGASRSAFMAALGWPSDAIARLARGDDPKRLVEPIHIAAASTDLEELRRRDPDAYAQLEGQARFFLDRLRSENEEPPEG